MAYTPITDSDPISPLENLINPRFVQAYTDFAAADTAVTAVRQIQTYKWTNATQRNAQTGMGEGDVGDQADTDQRWRYSGSAWVNITNGIFPVIPTGVSGTGTSVSANGLITLTNATGINIDGCFTSAFRNYMIKIDATTSAAATLSFTLRVGGVNATSAYDRTRLSGVGVTASSAQALNSSEWALIPFAIIGRHMIDLDVMSPALATSTIGTLTTASTDNPMTTAAGITTATVQHRTATAYDGFAATPASGNVNGMIRIFGYN